MVAAALFTSELSWLCDDEGPRFGASTAMESSGNRQLCSACFKLAPCTNARNWAPWHVTFLFFRFVSWRSVEAIISITLGSLVLDPLPGFENILVITVLARLAAFSPLGPFACSRNWASSGTVAARFLWQGWRTAWNDLLFTFQRAFHAAMQCFLRDDKHTFMGAFWAWLSCQWRMLTLR